MRQLFIVKPHTMRAQRGFTLTEVVIVLGIMGVILGAIWVATSAVHARNQVNKANQQIQQIVAGYRSLFAIKGVDTVPTDSNITQLGLTAGFFPADMTLATGAPDVTVYGPWGVLPPPAAPNPNRVSVRGDSVNNGIILSYWDVSSEVCVALASLEANSNQLIGSWVGPNGTSPNPVSYPPYGTGTPLTSSEIAADCSASNDNEVTFEYAVR